MKKTGARTLALAGLGLTLSWLGSGVAARAETMAQLYEKAKAEKSLVIYGGGPVEPYERWAREFEQQFPGIKISVTGGYSNVLDARINQQIKDKKLEVDLGVFQTVQDFVAWKKEGVLLYFKPEGYKHIDPSFREKDGAYTTIAATTISYAYNTQKVKPEDVPRSALDFLKPEFRGKLVTAYPADDDATLYVFADIVKKYGWGYMDKYMANKPAFIQGHLAELKSVGAGDNVVTFDATVSTTGGLKRQGMPIDVAFSKADKTPVFTVTAGIFKAAPHPNAAKLYLTWYMAKEQQSRTGTFSARNDVPPPAGLKKLFAYNVDNHYREFVSDEKNLVELRKRFEAYTGPVVNQAGVR